MTAVLTGAVPAEGEEEVPLDSETATETLDPEAANAALDEATEALEQARQAIEQVPQDGEPPIIEPAAGEAVEGADALKDAVAEQNMTAGEVIEYLDAFGFAFDETRVSIWSVLVIVLVIVGVFMLARMLTRLGQFLISRVGNFDASQQLLSQKILTVVVWTACILLGVDLLGIDLTALTVFSGAFGLAIGFGLQKTFGNLLAGIILLMDRSIKPGDVISVTDSSGKDGFGQIRKIGLRAISVVTRDRTEYLIPNENLMINQVVNWSYSSRDVRVKAPVGVSYGSDLELVEGLLLRAAKETPRILDDPYPRALLMGFGDSSVDFEIRFWIEDPEEGLSNIRSEVYMRVWKLFKEHNIEIPFPQRDLNLRGSEEIKQIIAALEQRVDKTP